MRISSAVVFLIFFAVSRYQCQGVTYDMDLVIDIHSELYPLAEGEKIALALVSTLDKDGKPDDGTYDKSGKVPYFLLLKF